jgi:AcrR family transcriptional regulator
LHDKGPDYLGEESGLCIRPVCLPSTKELSTRCKLVKPCTGCYLDYPALNAQYADQEGGHEMSSTRERIARVALDCFGRNGIRATTYKEIARKSKVSEITIYRYFPTKTALQKEILGNYLEQLLRGFDPNFIEIAETDDFQAFRSKLVQFALALKRYAKSGSVGRMLLFTALEAKEVRIKVVSRFMHAVYERTRPVFQEAVRRKWLKKPADYQLQVRSFVALPMHHWFAEDLYGLPSEHNMTEEEVMHYYVDAWLNGNAKTQKAG